MSNSRSISLLVVEDDLQLRKLYARSFQLLGVQVLTAAGVLDARGILAATHPDAVILDVGLEGDSGLELLAELPAETVVVVVTGHRDHGLVKAVLSAGADDLVFKPFAMEELIARVLGRVVARRRPQPVPAQNCLQLDPGRRVITCTREGRAAALSRQEVDALRLLAAAQGGIVSREVLSREVQGRLWDPSSRRVDALVSRVRRKLACARCDAQRELTAVHNQGYRLVPGVVTLTDEAG